MSPNSLAHLSRSPRFWRDERLPFVEARTIADGRKVTYSRHAHEHFSIGVVTTGRSYYHYGAETFEISAGTVVLMNPGDVHACNPIANEPWSYQMVYIDTPWLTDLQHQLGFSTEQGYRPFNTPYTRDTVLYEGLLELYGILVDEQAEHLQKQSSLVSYFTEVQQRLNPSDTPVREVNHKLERAADYIREHCTDALRLEDICVAGMGLFVADGDAAQVWLFAALYLVICYLSVACWAYAGTFLRRYLGNPRGVRVFNRSMAALLVASVGYLLMA
jgi:hypothetical protein